MYNSMNLQYRKVCFLQNFLYCYAENLFAGYEIYQERKEVEYVYSISI